MPGWISALMDSNKLLRKQQDVILQQARDLKEREDTIAALKKQLPYDTPAKGTQ